MASILLLNLIVFVGTLWIAGTSVLYFSCLKSAFQACDTISRAILLSSGWILFTQFISIPKAFTSAKEEDFTSVSLIILSILSSVFSFTELFNLLALSNESYAKLASYVLNLVT